MTTNLYIQARENSTRLPGKVLKKLCNKSLIRILFERMSKVKSIQKILLVTSPETKNKNLIDEAKKNNLEYFCNNENNILDRFYNASLHFQSDNIIRVTADNPFTDYDLINQALEIFEKGDYDILSNNRIKTFPLGLNFEIFTSKALQIAWKDTLSKFYNNTFYNAKIPPTQYMLYEKKFKNYDLINKKDLSRIRLTVDTPSDFKIAADLFERIYPKNQFFTLKYVIKHLDR